MRLILRVRQIVEVMEGLYKGYDILQVCNVQLLRMAPDHPDREHWIALQAQYEARTGYHNMLD